MQASDLILSLFYASPNASDTDEGMTIFILGPELRFGDLEVVGFFIPHYSRGANDVPGPTLAETVDVFPQSWIGLHDHAISTGQLLAFQDLPRGFPASLGVIEVRIKTNNGQPILLRSGILIGIIKVQVE